MTPSQTLKSKFISGAFQFESLTIRVSKTSNRCESCILKPIGYNDGFRTSSGILKMALGDGVLSCPPGQPWPQAVWEDGS